MREIFSLKCSCFPGSPLLPNEGSFRLKMSMSIDLSHAIWKYNLIKILRLRVRNNIYIFMDICIKIAIKNPKARTYRTVVKKNRNSVSRVTTEELSDNPLKMGKIPSREWIRRCLSDLIIGFSIRLVYLHLFIGFILYDFCTCSDVLCETTQTEPVLCVEQLLSTNGPMACRF